MLPWRCGGSSQCVTVCAQALPSQLSNAQPVQEATDQNNPALLPFTGLVFTGLVKSFEAYIGVRVLEKVTSGWPALDSNHSGDQ